MQYFEYAYRLWDHGLIDHPVFSSVAIHHGYWGLLGVYLIYVHLTLEDWRYLWQKIF